MAHYELIVIGAGPGGYEAALHAAKLGKKVAVVEKREAGGTCLNRGCIPTKTLLHSSQTFHDAKHGAHAGIHTDDIRADMTEIFAYKREISQKLSSGIESLFKTAKIDFLRGTALITAPGAVRVTDAEGGANEVLAGFFGMREMEAFAEGCGRVGSIEPVTVPELAKKAQKELAARCNQPFNGPAVQVKFADTGKTVRRLAVISGAGGSLFEDAIARGADCLLTGEANHHHAIDAKRLGLSLIAAGHYATEFPVTAAVAEKLRTAFPELEVLVSEDARDPYTYL